MGQGQKVNSFSYGSGRACVGCIANCGLFEAAYTGEMTAQTFNVLRSSALDAGRAATAFVVRLDGVQFSADDEPAVDVASYGEDVVPGAMIVRADQYATVSVYAVRAARYGVMRSVWLESHKEKAYEWAIRLALAAQPK